MRKTPLLLLVFAGLISGCVTGSHVLTGPARPAMTPEAVQIYSAPPEQAQIVGTVNSACELAGQSGTDKCLAELKRQAGKMGGNGLIIGPVSTTSNPALIPGYGGIPIYMNSQGTAMTGTALFVP